LRFCFLSDTKEEFEVDYIAIVVSALRIEAGIRVMLAILMCIKVRTRRITVDDRMTNNTSAIFSISHNSKENTKSNEILG
jgi:hypothetical protein